MAVAFPFDQLTSKPGAAINKLQTALNKVIAKLNQKVSEAIGKAGALSKNILSNSNVFISLTDAIIEIFYFFGVFKIYILKILYFSLLKTYLKIIQNKLISM
jgi:hypothetical protein